LPLELLSLPPDQLEKRKEIIRLELEDRTFNRRENILDFMVRSSQAISRFKPFGRDRYCNKFWWFDGGLSSVSLEAVTKIHDLEPVLDPYIPQEFATGYLFVEFCCDPANVSQDLFVPSSDLRQGVKDGRWGYYKYAHEVIVIN
jgi:hypothetical protein